MALALGSGFPVAFALPGSAILTIGLAGVSGFIFTGDASAFFHSSGPYEWLSAGVTNLRAVYWEPERDTLIAIPLFIFMGLMLQRSKVAEDLLLAMAQLFGRIPGGLGISVIFVGALLAATTGIVGATVVAMGLISLPSMLRNKYSPSLATGTIAASGTLGQIIPPSIVLIILADQLASASDQASSLRKSLFKESSGELSMPSVLDVTSTSAGEMFLGALVPGVVLVVLYMLYILTISLIRPNVAPAVPFEGKMDRKFWIRIIVTLIPPLTLILLVLGSILMGIATVNQAGAIGAAGAVFMGGFRLTLGNKNAAFPSILAVISVFIIFYCIGNYEMNVKAAGSWEDYFGLWLGAFGSILLTVSFVWSLIRLVRIDGILQGVMLETSKTTSLVFIILLGAAILTSAFRAFGGEELVRNFLNSLPGGFWSKFIIVMAVIFVLGFFLDFIEIAVVVVPIVAPILLADPGANITAVWLGVMIGLNIQTSFLTPPFGFALFYLRGVAPAVVKTVQIYKGVVPFIGLQLLALLIVGSYPPFVNYLPTRVNLLSENGPPPKNPKLQNCLEDYVSQQFQKNENLVKAAISDAKLLDLSDLPRNLSNDVFKAFDSAELAMDQLGKAAEAKIELEAASVVYRPKLLKVRFLEREISAIDKELKTIGVEIERLESDVNNQNFNRLENELRELDIRKSELVAQIPETWSNSYRSFKELMKKESKARQEYRRNADKSYRAPAELLLIFRDNDEYFKAFISFNKLEKLIQLDDLELAIDQLDQIKRRLQYIEGTDPVVSAISKLRRVIKKEIKKPNHNITKILGEYLKLDKSYKAQLSWRPKSKLSLQSGMEAYLSATEDTLGLRSQPQLDRKVALSLSTCRAKHEDILLNF